MSIKSIQDELFKICITASAFIILCIILLNLIWIASVCVYVRKVWRRYRWYQKHTDSVDSSSRWFILYNCKTHLTKCFFMLAICISEILMVVSFTVLMISYHDIRDSFEKKLNDKNITSLDIFTESILLGSFYASLIFFVLLFINLFSLLTQYLTARTRFQTYSPRCYLLWVVAQYAILSLCVFKEVRLALLVFVPVFCSINWVVLYKYTKKLSQALEFNLHSIWLIEQGSGYYRSQAWMVRIYKHYIRVLIAALFVQVAAIVIANISLSLELVLYDHYEIHRVYRKGFNFKLPHSHRNENKINHFTYHMIEIFSFVYLLMTALPPLLFTIALVVVTVYRRWKNGKPRYRFNYENQQLLLRDSSD